MDGYLGSCTFAFVFVSSVLRSFGRGLPAVSIAPPQTTPHPPKAVTPTLVNYKEKIIKFVQVLWQRNMRSGTPREPSSLISHFFIISPGSYHQIPRSSETQRENKHKTTNERTQYFQREHVAPDRLKHSHPLLTITKYLRSINAQHQPRPISSQTQYYPSSSFLLLFSWGSDRAPCSHSTIDVLLFFLCGLQDLLDC